MSHRYRGENQSFVVKNQLQESHFLLIKILCLSKIRDAGAKLQPEHRFPNVFSSWFFLPSSHPIQIKGEGKVSARVGILAAHGTESITL